MPAEVVIAVGEAVHTDKRAEVIGAESGSTFRQHLFAELESVGVPADRGVAVGQLVHGAQGRRVVGAQLRLLPRQRLFAEFEGLGVAAELGVTDGQVIHGQERVRMVRAQLPCPPRQHVFAETQSLRVAAEILLDAREHRRPDLLASKDERLQGAPDASVAIPEGMHHDEIEVRHRCTGENRCFALF